MDIFNCSTIKDDISQVEAERILYGLKTSFRECLNSINKPSILITGITGSGKSTLINSVFGVDVSKVGVGKPVTKHFHRFEPKNLPDVIYDSKGLEWDDHESFMNETKTFIQKIRKENDISKHIHCVWYVVNCGRGRIDSFELDLLKKVIAPTPIIVVLNKADLVDSEQLAKLKQVIQEAKMPEIKDIVVTISNRQTYSQSWCPECHRDDVFYDEETKEVECTSEECERVTKIQENFGLEKLVHITSTLLPEFAKDVFLYSQKISIQEKSDRTKEIAKHAIRTLSIGLDGSKFYPHISQMMAQMFVVWDYGLMFSSAFEKQLDIEKNSFFREFDFKKRLMLASADNILGNKTSKLFATAIAWEANYWMRHIGDQLSQHVINQNTATTFVPQMQQHHLLGAKNDEFMACFMLHALLHGAEDAIDLFWDLESESEEFKKVMKDTGYIEKLEEFMKMSDERNAQNYRSGGSVGSVGWAVDLEKINMMLGELSLFMGVMSGKIKRKKVKKEKEGIKINIVNVDDETED